MFDSNFFAEPRDLIYGALTGLVFGFLLQKGGVTRFQTIVGQFLMRDHTVMKVMFTAIIVGGIGIYGMVDAGVALKMHIKSATLWGNALGGVIFGVGMALLGYCPGTGVAALGDGSKHAIYGILGMIFGSALYAELHPWFKTHVLQVSDLGKETLASSTGISPWWFLAALAIGAILGFMRLERWELRRGRGVKTSAA
ncbi:MAG: YeeE/YedE family protein [Planctomycetes bacterium]|nr:YeeE/YedE family protein [Planctomycetota bacterium]